MSTTPIGDTPSERALFEAWALSEEGGWWPDALTRVGDSYKAAAVTKLWKGWAAGRAALTPPTVAAQAEPHSEYGETAFGWTFAGIALEEGDKRLMSLLVKAFGSDHPAVTDLTSLLFRSRAAQAEPSEQPRGMVPPSIDCDSPEICAIAKQCAGRYDEKHCALQASREPSEALRKAGQALCDAHDEAHALMSKHPVTPAGNERFVDIARQLPTFWENFRTALASREEAQPSERVWGLPLVDRIMNRIAAYAASYHVDATTGVISNDTASHLNAIRAALWGREEAAPEASDGFPYTRTFNAISAAIKWREHKTIEISVKKFVKAWHEGRASPPPAPPEANAHADWSAFSPNLQPPAPPTAAEPRSMTNTTMAEEFLPGTGRVIEFWPLRMERQPNECGIVGTFNDGRFWSMDGADHWDPSEIREWCRHRPRIESASDPVPTGKEGLQAGSTGGKGS